MVKLSQEVTEWRERDGKAGILLTDLQVQKAKPKAKAYRLADGGGLCSLCAAVGRRRRGSSGTGSDGKPQTATLGRLDDVTLAEAREKAREARKLSGAGRHVTTEQRVAKARRVAVTAGTFGSIADRLGRAPGATQAVDARLQARGRGEPRAITCRRCEPLPIADITPRLLLPSRERRAARARHGAKVEQRLHAIMDYGVRRGLIAVNPLPRPDPEKAAGRKHFAAILDRDGVGAILRDAERVEMSRGVRRAHLMTVFTAQRIGEIVPAQWSEVDLQKGTWSIPRDRMKRKDAERGPHIVPIPSKLLAMMREWRRADGDDAAFVCPAPNRDAPVTREAVEKLYRRGLGLSGQHSPHAWRSVFSSWARDAGKDGDAIEAQLDHVVGNKVAAAYDRAKRVELRRSLMTWYEAQLLAARDGAEVVPLRKASPPH